MLKMIKCWWSEPHFQLRTRHNPQQLRLCIWNFNPVRSFKISHISAAKYSHANCLCQEKLTLILHTNSVSSEVGEVIFRLPEAKVMFIFCIASVRWLTVGALSRITWVQLNHQCEKMSSCVGKDLVLWQKVQACVLKHKETSQVNYCYSSHWAFM